MVVASAFHFGRLTALKAAIQPAAAALQETLFPARSWSSLDLGRASSLIFCLLFVILNQLSSYSSKVPVMSYVPIPASGVERIGRVVFPNLLGKHNSNPYQPTTAGIPLDQNSSH